MKILDLQHITDVEVIDYEQLQKREKEQDLIVKVSTEVGMEIVELGDVYGMYIFKEGDVYIAVDNSEGDNWVEECANDTIAIRYLAGHIDSEDILTENERYKKEQKEKEEYIKGNMPKYFDLTDRDVTGSLIKINYKHELIDGKFVEKEDGTSVARVYWDYCEKFLRLCGCENIDGINIYNSDSVMMEIHLTMNKNKDEGILLVMFDDDLITLEVEKELKEKGITVPSIFKEFIIKKRFELGNDVVFEVTPIDFH